MELQDEEDMKYRDEMRRLNANSHLVRDDPQHRQKTQIVSSTNTSSSSLNRRKGKDDCAIL